MDQKSIETRYIYKYANLKFNINYSLKVDYIYCEPYIN